MNCTKSLPRPHNLKGLLTITALLGGAVFSIEAAEVPDHARLMQMVSQENFGDLEKLAGELRKEKYEFYNGPSKITRFYVAMLPEKSPGGKEWAELVGKLEKWSKVYPASVTARIALGCVYKEYAWAARGGGYATTVSDEGWRLFNERLETARANLLAAEKLQGPDPTLYSTLIGVATGLNLPRSEMESIFRRGTALDPNHMQLYCMKAFYLLPRWHGEPGDWENFAAEAADARGGSEGDILYMAIARSQLWTVRKEFFKNTKFDYQRLKKGFLACLKISPDIEKDRNWYCYFASLAGDRETAMGLFAQIGDRWDTEVWKNEGIFRQWKAVIARK